MWLSVSPPPHLLGNDYPSAVPSCILSTVLLQLLADVLQDSELQGRQLCLHFSPAHITLRQPLQEWLRGSSFSGGPTPHHLVAVDLSTNLITDLSRNLIRDLREETERLKMLNLFFLSELASVCKRMLRPSSWHRPYWRSPMVSPAGGGAAWKKNLNNK